MSTNILLIATSRIIAIKMAALDVPDFMLDSLSACGRTKIFIHYHNVVIIPYNGNAADFCGQRCFFDKYISQTITLMSN